MALTTDRSPDTNAVLAVLRGVNGAISWNDLAHQAGLAPHRVRQVQASARRILFSEAGVLFGSIRGHGLMRLADTDKVKKPEIFKRRVMRGAGRELKHLASIADFGGLSKTEQHAVTTNRTVLNVIRAQAQVRPEPPKTTPTTPLPKVDISRLFGK